MATAKKVTGVQERVFASFVEMRGDKPFRRSDLAEALRAYISPRSLSMAGQLADVFIQRARAAGTLVKAGHVHWRFVVAAERTLHSGRVVPDLPEVQKLSLDTRCPQKWAAVDLETGQVWNGTPDGWKNADGGVRVEIATILAQKGAEVQ